MAPRVRMHWRSLFGLPQVFLLLPAVALALGALALLLGVKPPGWPEAARLSLGLDAAVASWTLALCAGIVARVRQRPAALGPLRGILAASIVLTVVALALAVAGAAASAASPLGGMSPFTLGALLCNVVLGACLVVVTDAVPQLRDPEHGGAT